MADHEPRPGTWGACRFCGVAVAAGARHCEICGADAPVRAEEIPHASPKVRWRLRWTGALRTVIVVGVVVLLTYSLLSAVTTGPPVLTTDPLTTAGTYTLAPGNFTFIWGEITGGDYVLGNFSSVQPAGTNVAVAVYNSSGWAAFCVHAAATPVYSLPPDYQGRIVYSPLVTDTYYFVFENPYPAASHLTVSVYVTTVYESNVGNTGGMA